MYFLVCIYHHKVAVRRAKRIKKELNMKKEKDKLCNNMKSILSNRTVELQTKLDKITMISNLFPNEFMTNFIYYSAKAKSTVVTFNSILILAVEANWGIGKIPRKPSVFHWSLYKERCRSAWWQWINQLLQPKMTIYLMNI